MLYFGEHSIRFYPDESAVGARTFSDKDHPDNCPHTWETWHLVPTEKPIIQPPEADQNTLKIPGRHGLVNLNKYTYGKPIFGDRTGSIEFFLDPDYIHDWPAIYSDILRYFHGRERLMVLRDDRFFYYKGWFTVSDLTPGEYGDTVTISYDLEPFKYERWTSTEPWLWDDFDFRQGVIRDYQSVVISGEAGTAATLLIAGKPFGTDVSPVFFAPEWATIMSDAKLEDRALYALWTSLQSVPVRYLFSDGLPDYSTAYVVRQEGQTDDASAFAVQVTQESISNIENKVKSIELNAELQSVFSALKEILENARACVNDPDTTLEIKNEGILSFLPEMAQRIDDVWQEAGRGIIQASVNGQDWFNVFYYEGKTGTKLAVGGSEERQTLYLRTTVDTDLLDIVPSVNVILRGNAL